MGDRLPTVALAQARLLEMGEKEVVVDGTFDARTEAAVCRFQLRTGLVESGSVDPPTWKALSLGVPIAVVDVVDMTDFNKFWSRLFLNDGHSHVVETFEMSRGADSLIRRLLGQHAARSVALLRVHGHGSPGHQVVAAGMDGEGSSAFVAAHFDVPEAVSAYRRLGMIMKPYGSIELHGCHVGAEEAGWKLLSGIARACNVPVTAGVNTQYGGSMTDRLEGDTITCFPHGISLSSWAEQAFSQCRW